MPPRPGLAPWLSLISIARTGAVSTVATRRSRSKVPSRLRQPKYPVPICQTRSPPLRWWGEMPPSPVVCSAPARAQPLFSASMALPLSDPKLMAETFTTDDGPERLGPAGGTAEDLGARQGPGRIRVHRLVGRARHREGDLLDDRVVAGLLEVVVGAEPEVGVLRLRRRVHPAPVVTAERPLLVVVGDDVLAQLGADRLEDEAHVADHREVPQDGVLALGEVVDRQGHEPDHDRHEDPQQHPPDHGRSLRPHRRGRWGPTAPRGRRSGQIRARTRPSWPRW